MSRATAKRRRQARKAAQNINLVSNIDLLEPINISEAAFTRRMAKKQQQAATSGPQNLSMAWDDTSLGVGSTQTRDGLLDEKERKDTYYKVFLGNQWVSGCVNVIAKRITSGGWECVEVEQGNGDPNNKKRIQDLLRFENIEEDFLQFLRSIATDILVFGEAYCELVWQNGEVIGLYMIDAVSMTTHFDKHGTVIKYTQSLERSTQTVDFEPDQIIRWWLPDPRAKKKALSFIEHLKDPVYLEQSMITWVEKFFKQGARPNFSVELGPDTGVEDAQRYVKFFKENYTGIQNSHVPPVMYGGGKIQECGNGTIDIDFDKGQDKQRDRVLAVYGVPPAELNIIESGNIGGGTGESQNKAFMYNTVIPIEQTILEKFNYRVIQKGLGIHDWKINTIHADYRSDVDVVTIQDKQVRNGTKTINEVRRSGGSSDVVGGDEAVIIAGKDVVPVSRFKDVAAEQAQSAQIAIKMQQAQLDKAKQPPAPPAMPPMPPGQQQPSSDGQEPDDSQGPDNNQNGADNTQQPNAKQQQSDEQDDNAKEALLQYYLAREQKQWQQELLQESSHTGVMVAFFLKPSEAQQLVLPDGESIDDLHLTLAYLCDSSELSDHEALKMAVASYAQNAPVLKGVVSGIGRFLAVPDGELTPVYASIDSPNLSEFRENLVRALRSADFPPSMQHGYTPHCTLAYVPKSAPMPIKDIATIPLNFDTLWLAIGDDRYAFPLDRTEEHAQQQSAKTSKKKSAQATAQSTESRSFDENNVASGDTSEVYVYEGDTRGKA